MTLAEAFTLALVRERHEADLTQAHLAARAGLTASHVAHLEAGRRSPSFEVLGHLAAALGVPPWRLLWARKPRRKS
jgi:transcriptional regulator with XRE-family HTH domain